MDINKSCDNCFAVDACTYKSSVWRNEKCISKNYDLWMMDVYTQNEVMREMLNKILNRIKRNYMWEIKEMKDEIEEILRE